MLCFRVEPRANFRMRTPTPLRERCGGVGVGGAPLPARVEIAPPGARLRPRACVLACPAPCTCPSLLGPVSPALAATLPHTVHFKGRGLSSLEGMSPGGDNCCPLPATVHHSGRLSSPSCHLTATPPATMLQFRPLLALCQVGIAPALGQGSPASCSGAAVEDALCGARRRMAAEDAA